MRKAIINKSNKGFTLVELIVVLVILAILAAMMVPALLGYIDRANQQKNVQKLHDIQVAATSALVEFYGLHEGKTSQKFILREYNITPTEKINAYNITNWTFAGLQNDDKSNNDCSVIVARSMLLYLESKKSNTKKAYDFRGYTSSPFGKTASEIAASKSEGLIILFDEKYRIKFIQYSDIDGYLYTYNANKKSIDIEKNGKFISQGKEVKK